MISKNSFIDGVIKFASAEALPKMPNGVTKFLGYVGLGAIEKNPMVVFKPYLDMMESVGLLVNDEIDVDLLEDSLKMAFAQQSTISIAGFTFTANDVPSLMKYMA